MSGLLELLEPLGTVSAKLEGRAGAFTTTTFSANSPSGKNHARIQGRDADLTGKFLLENGRGLVPLASLNSLLPRFLGGPATFHEESGRLFIGTSPLISLLR